MKKIWLDAAWDQYLDWQAQDKKTLRRINDLLKDVERNGNRGIGKPEPLRHEVYKGYWSRRIDDTHRLIYRIHEDHIEIIQCKAHYDD
jgi:toxin YoeB